MRSFYVEVPGVCSGLKLGERASNVYCRSGIGWVNDEAMLSRRMAKKKVFYVGGGRSQRVSLITKV